MISRAVIVVLSVVAIALGGAQGATGAEHPVGSSLYVVQGDPRLCPSPLCGGYWVALANHARTECHDGARRPRCYVARILDERRHLFATDVPAGALARARIESQDFEGFGELGVLVAAEVFAPAGRAPETGRFFRLVDKGIRCIRAPCFSLRASRLNQTAGTTLSSVDIGAARAAPDELAQANAALATKRGLLARGHVSASPDGGRVFSATRLFLRSER